MKKLRRIMALSLLLVPIIVFADSSDEIDLTFAFAMEAFVSIHMSVFVLLPLSHMFGKENHKSVFWKLFIVRIVILLFFDIFVSPIICILDFMFVFFGAFVLVPICGLLTGNKDVRVGQTLESIQLEREEEIVDIPKIHVQCKMCDSIIKQEVLVCPNCGANVGALFEELRDNSPIVNADAKYLKSDNELLKNYIIEILESKKIDYKHLTTLKALKTKNILLVIMFITSLLTGILYYFNYNASLYVSIFLIVYIICLIINSKLDIIKTIRKEVKKHPTKYIDNIINEITLDTKENVLPLFPKMLLVTFIGIFIPVVLFVNQTVIYTKYESGYKVFKYTKGLKENASVVIPETYKGKPVLAIGEKAFKNSNILEIELPEGLLSIHISAFENTDLQEIVIPSTVKDIRAYAFADCNILKSVMLYEGLEEIRAYAFYNNVNLVDISLPTTLTYLGASVFENAESLKYVTIPTGVTEIMGATFKNCYLLSKVLLHDGIVSIHGEAFMNNVSLEDIVLPKYITEIRGSTFEGCSSLSLIDIPEGVTRIGGHAFHGCSSLTYVYIPKNVKEIGSSAFRECYNLRKVKLPESAIVNERAFKSTTAYIETY